MPVQCGVLLVLLLAVQLQQFSAHKNPISNLNTLPHSLTHSLIRSLPLRAHARSPPAPARSPDADLLLRALNGQRVERPPVWLMRQAGRYMKDFRKFSDKYSFRERSETPAMAVELSLQPWRAFGTDAVIMFSDILTPLPAMGVDFDIVPGQGPIISNPIRSARDIDRLRVITDADEQVPFIRPILQQLRQETEGKTTLIGFVGAPWTLAAYMVEGRHSKLCTHTKRLCLENPADAHKLLTTVAKSVANYALHQIECGAQVIQIFESWAHHLSEEQFNTFAKPYAQYIHDEIKKRYNRDVPVVYFANGGSAYLASQNTMKMDALALDWRISMKQARAIVGPDRVLCGNVDPMVLYGTDEEIKRCVKQNIIDAGPSNHVLNLGHGVEKDTREGAVRAFVSAAREGM